MKCLLNQPEKLCNVGISCGELNPAIGMNSCLPTVFIALFVSGRQGRHNHNTGMRQLLAG
jgi:hypothetical protein